jgi:putative hemolysin
MLWTDCATPSGSACAVRKYQSGRTYVVSSGGAGAQNVLGDAASMFWSDSLPKRYVH